MELENVKITKNNNTALVEMTNIRKKNAFSYQMQQDLRQALQELEADKETRVIILTGTKEFFAAGGDISQMVNFQGPGDARRYLAMIHDLFNYIAGYPKVVIAAVAGIAYGGGFELAISCDLRVVAENVKFGLPEVKLGLMAGAGGTSRLPRIIGATRAKELLFTGRSLDAAEAERLGLVNKVVPVDDLLAECRQLAEKIAAQPYEAVCASKLSVDTCLDVDRKTASQVEQQIISNLFQTEDAKEGLKAFMEKRNPVFKHK